MIYCCFVSSAAIILSIVRLWDVVTCNSSNEDAPFLGILNLELYVFDHI